MATGKQRAAIKRMAGGMPVRDATMELTLVPSQHDLAVGVPADFEHCPIAECARRICGASLVLIMREYAYIDMADESGERVVERFILPEATKRAIIEFDLHGTMPAGGFRLAPPPKSLTLEGHRLRKVAHRASSAEADKRYRERVKRAREKGEPRPTGRADLLTVQGVRTASGRISLRPPK